jgi:hypothetical protein
VREEKGLKVARVFCPQCSHRVKLRFQPTEGRLERCQHCKVALEIVSLEPLELDWADFELAEEEKEWEREEESQLWNTRNSRSSLRNPPVTGGRRHLGRMSPWRSGMTGAGNSPTG